MKSKRLRYAFSMTLTSLLVATQVTPLALAQTESVPSESEFVQQQQEATYPVGVEVRNIEGTRTEQVGISLTDEKGNIYDGGYNENSQWLTGSSLPEGQYYIEMTPPEGTTSQINNTAPQFAVATETPNVYSIDVNEENLGGLSAVYGAFELVDQPVSETYRVGAEVRGLDGTRTSDVGITVYDVNSTVYEGGYNEYAQWLTTNELPEGLYYIELTTPEGTMSQISTTTNQSAVPTETPNLYTIELNEETLGNLTSVYGAFELIETAPVEQTFRLGAEVRGIDGRRTSDVGITVWDANEMYYDGTYNEYLQWLTNDELPEGEYFITLTPLEGFSTEINLSTDQYAMETNTPNVYSIFLSEDNLGSSSAIYAAFNLVEAPAETYQLGVEVRGLDGTRTDEVGITVADVDGVTFEGAYNEYLQWLTTEGLLAGQYTITLDTPEGTVSTINDTTNQFAIPADETNVYNIILNEENLGSSSAIYGAFNLVEAPAEIYQLGVEVRGLNGTRTDEVGITVADVDGVTFEGVYNEYLQWLTTEGLLAGQYTITLDTPEGTVSTINDTTNQFAIPADETNVYNIILNEENLGSNSAIYGAFNLVEAPAETYQLGVEVRGLVGTRTDESGITVTDADGVVFEGEYNEYLQWLTDDELPEGTYTITLDTPEGTVSEINDTTNQYAVATDEENVYTIELNEDNLGSSSAVYGAFRLVDAPLPNPDTFTLGVEVRGLNDRRTDEVGVTVTNNDGDEFTGSYNEYLQWLTDDELPEGVYVITLDTPEGTVSEINDTTNQYAVATDEDDVYTIELNDENLGSSSAIYGAFRLVEAPVPNPDTFTLGVEVRGLDDRRTDEVGVTVTNNDGDEFTGSYNEYLQWLTDEELPEGTYIITLDTPAGTVSEINDTTDQYAVATDEDDVYTIELNEDNLGSSSAIYGAFRLIESDENGGGGSESSDESSDESDGSESSDESSDDESNDESNGLDESEDESDDDGNVIVVQDDDILPTTGESNTMIITVVAIGLLAVGGLLLYRRKRS